MATPTIANYLSYASLQMAAEALYDFKAPIPGVVLTPGAPYRGEITAQFLTDGNLHASKFTSTEAEKFANEWEVIEHKSNTETGFSGTLFKNRFTNELVLSFRSTEFIDDSARDCEATNQLEIKNLGWAFGQLSDMETWYAELKAAGHFNDANGQPAHFSVTGYSLGGHLATAFNLMHGPQSGIVPAADEPILDQVITFNGAGVGRIGDANLVGNGGTLSQMIGLVSTLRGQAGTPEGLEGLMQSELGKTVYRDIRSQLAGSEGIPTNAILLRVGQLMAGFLSPEETKDYALLSTAVSRAISVYNEAHRVPDLTSGATDGPLKPATIPDSAIAGESLDYQIAVLYTAREYSTSARSQLGGLVGAITDKLYGDGGTAASPPLANQYEIVGTEDNPTYPASALVAHSQWHYGTDVPLFIEDQPLTRGSSVLDSLKASIKEGGFKLLVDGYSKNDFGDTHSLVLIVDSLNVQNTLLQLVPENQRGGAAATLEAILRQASWRTAQSTSGTQGQAEGDVLENVVNALADLCLGPDPNRVPLKGSLDGNTWFAIDDASGDMRASNDCCERKAA